MSNKSLFTPTARFRMLAHLHDGGRYSICEHGFLRDDGEVLSDRQMLSRPAFNQIALAVLATPMPGEDNLVNLRMAAAEMPTA